MTALAFTFLAVYVSQEAERICERKDDPRIVVDEIAGYLWTMFLVTPTVVHCALGFIFFRFFDIVKVFPADYLQRKAPGGFGVVMDDWAAGVYSNILLWIVIKAFNI